MITAPFMFFERVILWNHCGNHQVANLREASTYLRLIEKLRPTDEEKREAQFRITERGFSWTLPHDNFGNRLIQLEDDEALSLARVIEAQENVKVSDAEWMLRLLEVLGETPVRVGTGS